MHLHCTPHHPIPPPYYTLLYATILAILTVLSDRGIYPPELDFMACKKLRDRLVLLLVTQEKAACRVEHVMGSRSSGPETVSRALNCLQRLHILESFLSSPPTYHCLSLSPNKRSLKIAPSFVWRFSMRSPLRLISFRLLGNMPFRCHSPPPALYDQGA